ncbi:Secreted repeat of unknown function [Alloactinosynnema sp. L-07]|uniref:hypothetical protein n=1 Tax=Alloactinosynnema sp. L-07 TaxID=1653480 RepID=UPI00065EFAFC|nr:hypothetical protein [Alloactinosynnema sp. L-07]CRK56267.1 Secreted repeat of unknown function [Alloactinosynnema sp. L-07]
MNRIRVTAFAASAVIGVFALSACTAGQQTAGAPVAAPEVLAKVTLAAADIEGLGAVVTDVEGRTLYRFDKDKAKPPTSTCDGECAVAWPPALAGDTDIAADGVDEELIGTLERGDGTRQLTLNGWPLYRFAKDKAVGEAKGQGVGGTWFAATPEGKKAVAEVEKDAVRLTAKEIADLGTGVVDAKGYTLYRFDKDKAKPSKSSCDGDCAKAWPPVLAKDSVDIEGIDEAIVGTVVRADGSRQLTLNGWPLYRFAKDTAPGEAKGHGVGGTWFATTPAGKKAAAAASGY